MTSNLLRNVIAAFALGTAIGAPIGMASAASSDHRTFTGAVSAVSRTNLKVHSIEGGMAQTISFDFAPNDRLRRKLHLGEQVTVRFDQKLLGLRHLDAVYVPGHPNRLLGP